MPELPEVRIMSNYINENVKDKTFTKMYHVQKGNIPVDANIKPNFKLKSIANGKELLLNINHDDTCISISVFMGMSGNWLYTTTKDWTERKFTRLRLDTTDGYSLLLWGLYMGPKYRIGGFTGVKRGPDPTKNFKEFKDNITNNLEKKIFDKPICEAILDQKYFNGIGNYIRSTILHYADVNPFQQARECIKKNPQILQLCKDVPLKSIELNGAQLMDWKNPFDVNSEQFDKWVYYQKGLSCKDNTGRTFWFDEKWKDVCPYAIK